MTLPNLYHRRKLQAENTGADVYRYDNIPAKVRQQIVLILRKHAFRVGSDDTYETVVDVLREEVGSEKISNEFSKRAEFDTWFREWDEIDLLLSAIEMSAKVLLVIGHKVYKPKEAQGFIETVNARLLEGGVGYQIEDYKIVRVDSKYLHNSVVVPALSILSDPAYVAADGEFRQAHKEYVDGNFEDSIHDCCNAFESVLKIILTKKGWAFNVTDTASRLLSVAFSNNLIPSYLQAEFTGLRTILESGVPTIRNKDAGHGAGANPRNIPGYLASFQLHQTAAAILLLVEAAK